MPKSLTIKTTDPDTIDIVEAFQAEVPGRYTSLSRALDRIVRDWHTHRMVKQAQSQTTPLGQHLDTHG